jgi:16S rRNA (cytidine1402-2'-O)-methyltransferase
MWILINYPGLPMAKATLYLIPTLLGNGYPPERVLPEGTLKVIQRLDHFIAEEIKTARRFLKRIGIPKPMESLHFHVYNEHSNPEDLLEAMHPLLEGLDTGLLSEAGMPCIADPGEAIVLQAHKQHIRVVPLSGPSSVLLALMASGFNGQRFAFHGYLPVERVARIHKIKELERLIRMQDQTQIFIETPYRNLVLFDTIIHTCSNDLLLCIARELTTDHEKVETSSIQEWRTKTPDLNRKPAVFLLYHQK